MLKLFVSIIIVTIIMLSCTSSLPTISKTNTIDKNTPIYYQDIDFSIGDFKFYGFNKYIIEDSLEENIFNNYSHIGILDFTNHYNDFTNYYNFNSSISFDGNFIIRKGEPDVFEIDLHFGKQSKIDLFDVRNQEFIFNMVVELPRFEYERELYSIPWSKSNDGFYIMDEDTIKKIGISGNSKNILGVDNIRLFQFSDTEDKLLLYHDDIISYYDLTKDSLFKVYEVGTNLGSKKFIRGLTWSPDEQKFTFIDGWRIYIYDLTNKEIKEFNAGAKAFSIEWVTNNRLIYVCGNLPADISQLKSYTYFEMNLLHVESLETILIHKRINHEPLTIKPRISPSKELILFSERDLNSSYKVKLMTLDGKFMRTLADGFDPIWHKSN